MSNKKNLLKPNKIMKFQGERKLKKIMIDHQ